MYVQYLTKITYAAHAVLLQEVMRDRLIYTRVRLTALKTKTRGTRLIKSRRVDASRAQSRNIPSPLQFRIGCSPQERIFIILL